MVRTDYRYGLNPIVVKALTHLHYRYSNETPKMWCSRIRVSFKKLLEYNPKFFSKNEFIHMTEREYKYGKFGPGRRTFHIYCTACDSLVFICDNTEKCANKHLNECIAKIEERRIAYRKSSECYCRTSKEIRKKTAYHIFNNAKIIQRAWRAFKLRPETWAKRVWNMVRNDNTPDEKKYLGITPRDIRIPDDQYVDYFGQRILARDVPAHHQNEPRLRSLYYHYTPHDWAEKKKYQLYVRLTTVAYIVTFIKSYQQNYRFVGYSDWTIMLKYLANPGHYHTTKDYYNNIVTNFVKISEYARYKCKKEGKLYPCNSLEIDMFKSSYITTFDRGLTIIDFSDFNNNYDYVQQILWTIDSLLK
ncbi:uncharacterized protein OCT59_013437 [Rhizophagus irregularis]|nr:hypothetical protein OCT59_013437 [Rhizophagus irregularis]GBC45514.1 hypothetical protein GLOIN_2v1800019 [Rhizophagus irregularis DAOM 181602=DAOM 197198]